MPTFLTEEEFSTLVSMCDRLIPPEQAPGAAESGAANYIDLLLGAFSFDPPRIWASGPFSGRFGGEPGFDTFLPLSPLEELAWRIRIEGSRGRPEREFNGPVVGLQQQYRDGLAGLGTSFSSLDPEEQDRRLRTDREFTKLVYEHCCEATYGAPEYGGNRDLAGWQLIDFAGDVQPRGYSDEEVAEP
jgi:hypothetical protein